MKTQATKTDASRNDAASSAGLPQSERRKFLKRLGTAAVTVPAVTVLHDATKNTALAC